jgi:hypothetical protein
LQQLEHPRLVHEKEDVHLLRTFGFNTKMNDADWRISQQLGHRLAQNAIGKDFYAIPERIFLPLDEGNGGHTSRGPYKQELKEIQDNSIGKIEKIYGPYYYEDGSGDYHYDFGIKLSGSKTASVLIENGSKTWKPFAVSAHIFPKEGNDDNITDAEFMGLALVLQGAYGDQSVVNKYCKGSATLCQKSLTAAIQDVINSSLVTNSPNTYIMSTQQVQTSQGTVPNNGTVPFPEPQVQAVIPVEEKKDITLTKEEYDKLQSQLKEQETLRSEVTSLRNEYKTNILNQVFSAIEDENTKDNLVKKYFEKDEKLVKELYEDFTANILPKEIEKALKEAKESNKVETESKSKTASSLTPEPKKEKKEESLTASIPDKEITVSEFLKEIGL